MTKKLKLTIYSSMGLIGATGIIAPIAVSYTGKIEKSTINRSSTTLQQKTDYLSNFSTKWNNNTKNTQVIQNDFNSIVNFDKNKKESTFISLIKTSQVINNNSNSKFSTEISKVSNELKVLPESKTNQIKNEMLYMYLASKNNGLNYNTLPKVLSKITSLNNIQYIENQLISTKENGNTDTNKINLFVYHPFSFTGFVSCGTVADKLTWSSDAFAILSGASAAFAAMMYGFAGLSFGGTLPWATGATVVAAVSGVIAGSLSIAAMTVEGQANKLSDGLATSYNTLITVYGMGNFLPSIIVAITTTTETLTAFSWVFPAIGAALSVAAIVVSFLQQFNIIS